MTIPKTIKTKDFGDIPVDADADWGKLSVHEDVGFPAGDHLYCFVSMDASSCLGYYITTAYGSQRELESGKVIIEPTMVEVHEVTCDKCHMLVQFTEIHEFCPNCLAAVT